MYLTEIHVKNKVTLGMCAQKACLRLALGDKRYKINKSQDFSWLPNSNTAQYVSYTLKYCSKSWQTWLWKAIYFFQNLFWHTWESSFRVSAWQFWLPCLFLYCNLKVTQQRCVYHGAGFHCAWIMNHPKASWEGPRFI